MFSQRDKHGEFGGFCLLWGSHMLGNPFTGRAMLIANSIQVATTVIQPIDMVKVRIQLAGEGAKGGPKPSPFAVTRDIVARGKILDLYTGLSAGLLRQAVYTTARIGLFDTFQGTFKTRAEAKGRSVNFFERAVAASSAGGLAAFVGNPADLALIRMQSDGLKSAATRANYTSGRFS